MSSQEFNENRIESTPQGATGCSNALIADVDMRRFDIPQNKSEQLERAENGFTFFVTDAEANSLRSSIHGAKEGAYTIPLPDGRIDGLTFDIPEQKEKGFTFISL